MFELLVDAVREADPAVLAGQVLALGDATIGAFEEGQAEAVVLATQRVLNAAGAVQLLAIESLADRQREVLAGEADLSPFGAEDAYEFLGDRVAPLLAMTPRGADIRVGQARTICRQLPRTLAAMRAGDLDLYRASVIADELESAAPPVVAAVEEHLFPAVLTLTSTRLRALARRRLHAADPAALRRRAERARAGRFVSLRPGDEPGLSHWQAEQPTETSAAAWAAIDELAHRYVADGEHRTLGQARADAMLDLILGNAEVATVLEVLLPVGAALTRADLPGAEGSGAEGSGTEGSGTEGSGTEGSGAEGLCSEGSGGAMTGVEVPRAGLILSETVLQLLASVDTRLRPVLTDPATGWVREVGADVYEPRTALKRQVRVRDGTCRFPGCRRAAGRCDLDHVIPFPLGPTVATNLMALCRHHHRLKHHAGWTVTMTPLGVCTWTTPTGVPYVTTPMDYRELVA